MLCTAISQILFAKALQCALTQEDRDWLALFREVHNPLGDDFVNLVETVGNTKGYARHFERDAHDAGRLAIKFNTVQEWGYRHDLRSPNLGRERHQAASANAAIIATDLSKG
jgi:hypothetical protein